MPYTFQIGALGKNQNADDTIPQVLWTSSSTLEWKPSRATRALSISPTESFTIRVGCPSCPRRERNGISCQITGLYSETSGFASPLSFRHPIMIALQGHCLWIHQLAWTKSSLGSWSQTFPLVPTHSNWWTLFKNENMSINVVNSPFWMISDPKVKITQAPIFTSHPQI